MSIGVAYSAPMPTANPNRYQSELRQAARAQKRYDRAWTRYIEALVRLDDVQEDGRANYARRRAVRAARRNLTVTCEGLGVECPV